MLNLVLVGRVVVEVRGEAVNASRVASRRAIKEWRLLKALLGGSFFLVMRPVNQLAETKWLGYHQYLFDPI